MTQKQEGPLCGFLNVLKPPGMSSAQVVGVVRRLLNGEKVGHGGTLDPEAAGVLPLMVGKATRLFDDLQEKEKAYVAEVAFGCATDTQDAQGACTRRGGVAPGEEAVQAALARFLGEQWQVPPQYSALKQEGKRMYALAREGKAVELPPRAVTVHELSLRRMTENQGALLFVRCSKGFYVRTLCQDLGEALGCPAHMRFLLRTQSGQFTLETAHTLEALAQAKEQDRLSGCLLTVERVLSHLPQAEVPAFLRKAFLTGGKLPWAAFSSLQGVLENTPVCLWAEGRIAAIGQRQGQEMKLRTWLGA